MADGDPDAVLRAAALAWHVFASPAIFWPYLFCVGLLAGALVRRVLPPAALQAVPRWAVTLLQPAAKVFKG